MDASLIGSDQNRLQTQATSLESKPQVQKEFHAFGEDGFNFWDMLDVINPLQHIPVVGTLYRDMTGDELSAVPKVAGGTLFGGPIGLIANLVDVGVEYETGQDMGEHAMAFFRDLPAEDDIQVVDMAVDTSDPEVAALLASEQAAFAAGNASLADESAAFAAGEASLADEFAALKAGEQSLAATTPRQPVQTAETVSDLRQPEPRQPDPLNMPRTTLSRIGGNPDITAEADAFAAGRASLAPEPLQTAAVAPQAANINTQAILEMPRSSLTRLGGSSDNQPVADQTMGAEPPVQASLTAPIAAPAPTSPVSFQVSETYQAPQGMPPQRDDGQSVQSQNAWFVQMMNQNLDRYHTLAGERSAPAAKPASFTGNF